MRSKRWTPLLVLTVALVGCASGGGRSATTAPTTAPTTARAPASTSDASSPAVSPTTEPSDIPTVVGGPILTALNLDGTVRWTVAPDAELRTVDYAFVSGDVVVGTTACYGPAVSATWDLASGVQGRRTQAGDAGLPQFSGGGVTLVQAPEGGVVVAIDESTGAERWRANGVVTAQPRGDVVLLIDDIAQRLRAVELATGRVKWDMPTDPGFPGVVTDATRAYLSSSNGVTAIALEGGSTLWSAPLSPGSDRFAVEVGDGMVFGMALDGAQIVALDAATGVVKWKLDGQVLPQQGPLPFFGDGNLYVQASGGVMAIDAATGQVRWSSALAGRQGLVPNLLGAIPGGVLVGGVGDAPELVALLADTGAEWWRHSAAGTGGVSAGDGVVLLASGCGGGAAVAGAASAVRSSDGIELWHADAPALPFTPLLGDGLALIGGTDSCAADSARLIALDEQTGEQRWRRDYTPPSASFVPGVSPAVVGDTVGLLEAGALVGLDLRTGAERWRQPTTATGGPVVVDELFVAASGTEPEAVAHGATAYRADGTRVWQFSEPTSVAQVLAMTAAGGRVFLTEYTPEGAFQLRALAGASGTTLWTAPGGGASANSEIVVMNGDNVTALDAASGQERWGQPGISAAVSGDLVIMLDNQEAPPAVPPIGGGPIELSADLVARRAADGGEQWRVPRIVGNPTVAGDLVLLSDPESGTRAFQVADGRPAWESAVRSGGPVAQDPSSGVTLMTAGGEPTGCGD